MTAPAQNESVSAIAAFLVRYWLCCALLWISSKCIWLARFVASTL